MAEKKEVKTYALAGKKDGSPVATSTTNLAMFTPAADIGNKYKLASLPPLLTPKHWPVGSMIEGKITGLVAKPEKKKVNPICTLELKDGNRVAVSMTTVIEGTLAREFGEDRNKWIGREIALRYDGKTETGGQGGKGFHRFAVFIVET